MKLKLRFVALLLIGVSNLFGSKRLEIYLSFNECTSCFSALSVLGSLNDCSKTFMIQKSDSSVSKEFFENLFIPKDVKYNYVATSINGISYCKFYFRNALADSFPLIELPGRLKTINSLSAESKGERAFALPKGLVLKSDRLELFVRKNYINVYDYILNKNLLFEIDSHKDTIIKTIELKGGQFPPKLFLKAGRFDSVLYYKSYDDLKKLGKANAHIESAFLTDSTLVLLLNFPYVYLKPGNPKDTVIDMSFFVYERNFLNDQKRFSFLNESQVFKKYGYRYFIDNTRPFYMRSGKLFLSLSDEERTESSIRLFSDWSRFKKGFEFDRLDSLSLNKGYYLDNKVDSFALQVNSRFYFSSKLKLIVDHTANKIIYLQGVELTKESYVLDISQNEGVLNVVLSTNDLVEFLSFDLTGQKMLSRRPVKVRPECAINTVKFYDHKNIVFLNKASTRIYLMGIGEL